MIDLTTPIIPYVGTGIFKLDASYDEVKAQLEAENISYTEEISQPNDIDPPWTIITISKADSQYHAIDLFFAKNRLFRIYLSEDFEGALPNGVHIGMNIEEAEKIDVRLKPDDDWDEVYISPDGYFLEIHMKTWNIVAISVFIPAFERDDFFDYKW